jgi:hypothetical protein
MITNWISYYNYIEPLYKHYKPSKPQRKHWITAEYSGE